MEEEHSEITDIEEIKETKIPKPTQEIALREEVVHRTLAAYMEVCVALRTPQRGLSALLFHRIRSKRTSHKVFPPVKNIHVYNMLLKGFAVKGDFVKVQEVLKYAAEEGVSLNVQSYVSILECLARVNIDNNHLKFIRIFTKDARKQGITYDRIVSEGIFSNGQRELVLRAMRCNDHSYEPQYSSPYLQYDNNLLNHLNCQEQTVIPNLTKANGGSFAKTNWQELINKQIDIETEGFVTVSPKFAHGHGELELAPASRTLVCIAGLTLHT